MFASNGFLAVASALGGDYDRVTHAPSAITGDMLRKLLVMTLEAVQDLVRIVQNVLETEIHGVCVCSSHLLERVSTDPDNHRGLDLIAIPANDAVVRLMLCRYTHQPLAADRLPDVRPMNRR